MKRADVQRMCVSILLCGTLMWTACSTTWIGEAEQIVGVLIPAAANVMTLIATLRGSVPAADLQTAQSVESQVNSDLQLLQELIGQYERAGSATQPALLSRIKAALSAVQSNLSGLAPALHIKDAATQEKVSALVGIVLSEVQSMSAILPTVNGMESAVTLKKRTLCLVGRTPLSASDFVNSYNAAMLRKTGDAGLDRATSRLRIHAHGKLERWASAGLLK